MLTNIKNDLMYLLNILESIEKIELYSKDFRNKVVHNYVNLDIFMIFDIIKHNLPGLKGPIEDIIIFEISIKNFDFEELVASKDSIYYKHINFCKLIKG